MPKSDLGHLYKNKDLNITYEDLNKFYLHMH